MLQKRQKRIIKRSEKITKVFVKGLFHKYFTHMKINTLIIELQKEGIDKIDEVGNIFDISVEYIFCLISLPRLRESIIIKVSSYENDLCKCQL